MEETPIPIQEEEVLFERKKYLRWALFAGIAALFVCVGIYLFAVRAPKTFPAGDIVEVRQGEALSKLAERLEEEGVVRSMSLFQFFAIFFGDDRAVVAGQYYFDRPLSSFAVAKRMVNGDHGFEPVKITLPEGLTAKQMAEILSSELPFFEKEVFIEEAKEGYLFPDTYFFFPTAKAEEVVKTLEETFEKKTSTLSLEGTGRTLEEVVIMGSIIEAEASKDTERAIISGILWKRISLGMPLQVDAAFKYILGKGSAELTRDDLKVSSPYNTYTNKGLPPGPIGNPGLASLTAAAYPESSPYLYYLHGNDGIIRYAKTHAEHVRNKEKYLK